MFDLMIGTDAVQRRTQRSFASRPHRGSRRSIAVARAKAATGLRTLADRIEPAPRGGATYAVGGEM
jgi:hypothetical protein